LHVFILIDIVELLQALVPLVPHHEGDGCPLKYLTNVDEVYGLENYLIVHLEEIPQPVPFAMAIISEDKGSILTDHANKDYAAG
jgi:hypothetical protein